MVVSEEYPIHLGLAYLFFAGYLIRTVFIGLRLPGAVGVIVSGFAFSYFMQMDLFEGRDHLQGLAFFLVLLTAGTEISLGDLKPYIVVCAIVPATLELSGIAAYAYYVLEWTMVESCILGVVLFGLGDGLVIPKMSEFGQQFPGHHLPRLVFIWAPLEASYALTLFGVVSGLADPAGEESSSIRRLALANVLRLAATLAAGALAGSAAGWIISNRSRLPVPFSGATVEAYLIILATALAGFGISSSEGGPPLVPMGFASGSLFQPELMVIVIGSMFARVVDPEVLHNVELTMGGVWVFGQIMLFSMLGSKTDVGVFAQIASVLPILVVGLCLRFLGVLLVTVITLHSRPCTCPACFKANRDSVVTDAVFCFLATLPRATLQGALGPVPMTQRFFHRDPTRGHVQLFISIAARLYIVCMSVMGSILLDAFGPRLLSANQLRQVRCIRTKASEKEFTEQGWTLKERRMSQAQGAKASIMLSSLKVECERERLSRVGNEKMGRSSLPPGVVTGSGVSKLLRKGKTIGWEDRPLLQPPRKSSVHSRRSSWHMEVSSQATSSARSRTSTFSSMHQLEGRLVEEPPPTLDIDDDGGGELWDGTLPEEDEEETPGFLPNTNITGDPVEECDVEPL